MRSCLLLIPLLFLAGASRADDGDVSLESAETTTIGDVPEAWDDVDDVDDMDYVRTRGNGTSECDSREVYLDCPAAHKCDRFCRTLNQACVITPVCTPGCFCRSGLARNAAGRCVPYRRCPGKAS